MVSNRKAKYYITYIIINTGLFDQAVGVGVRKRAKLIFFSKNQWHYLKKIKEK